MRWRSHGNDTPRTPRRSYHGFRGHRTTHHRRAGDEEEWKKGHGLPSFSAPGTALLDANHVRRRSRGYSRGGSGGGRDEISCFLLQTSLPCILCGHRHRVFLFFSLFHVLVFDGFYSHDLSSSFLASSSGDTSLYVDGRFQVVVVVSVNVSQWRRVCEGGASLSNPILAFLLSISSF